jgi:hypothetical protein
MTALSYAALTLSAANDDVAAPVVLLRPANDWSGFPMEAA